MSWYDDSWLTYYNSLSSLSSMITPLLHAYLNWCYVLESINPYTNHNKKWSSPPTHQIREYVVSQKSIPVSMVMTAERGAGFPLSGMA